MMLSVCALMMMAVTACQAQNNGYRQAPAALRPTQPSRGGQQAPSPAFYSNSLPQQSRSTPRPAPVPASAPVPAPQSDNPELDQEDIDLLQKFDDYLFDNLEKMYYRLSYAFEDASKRTLDNRCRCDEGQENSAAPPS